MNPTPSQCIEHPTPNHSFSFILRLGVRESFPRRRKLAKFMPDHVLGHSELVVDLAVVYLKLETDEVG